MDSNTSGPYVGYIAKLYERGDLGYIVNQIDKKHWTFRPSDFPLLTVNEGMQVEYHIDPTAGMVSAISFLR